MTDKQPDALALADHLEQFRSFPDDLAAAAELRRLHAELVESDAMREKLSAILRRTATALKGEPDEFSVHSWHDLLEVAMTLHYEVDAIAAIKEERGSPAQAGIDPRRLLSSKEFEIMTCCDDYGNCRQGRDCPIRASKRPPQPGSHAPATARLRWPVLLRLWLVNVLGR